MSYLEDFSKESKKIVGSRIRQCRTSMSKKMSAADLSKALSDLGIEGLAPSERTITKYETGQTSVPLPVLLAMSQIFECDASWLAGLTDSLAPEPSLTRIPFHQSAGNRSLSHLSFKSSWLDAKGVSDQDLVLVVSENELGRKTFLLNKLQNRINSDGYYGLLINGECIVRFVRMKLSGSVCLYSDSNSQNSIEEFSRDEIKELEETSGILGRSFWVAMDL